MARAAGVILRELDEGRTQQVGTWTADLAGIDIETEDRELRSLWARIKKQGVPVAAEVPVPRQSIREYVIIEKPSLFNLGDVDVELSAGSYSLVRQSLDLDPEEDAEVMERLRTERQERTQELLEQVKPRR